MFYFLNYNEDYTFILKSERGDIIKGIGSEQLFSIPKPNSTIYDANLSITKYLIGADRWDECLNSFKDGQTNKLKKGSLTFINSKNIANNLTINKVKMLKKEYKKLPTSQAALVRERIKNLEYPDFKCWMTNEAFFKVIRYVMPGALMGYNSNYGNCELSACQWDIKSCYPSIMLFEKFPTSFLKVIETHDLNLLTFYVFWIGNFYIENITLKPEKCIDWLPRNKNNIYSFTTLDFKMFYEDYCFEDLRLDYLIIHHKMDYLPTSIRNFIKTSLLNKDNKKNTKVYEEAKRNTNIIYGCFYGIPQRQDTKNNYRMSMNEEKRRPSIVGVWVTSYARYRLWKALQIYPESVIYWNTDGFITIADISEEIKKLNTYDFNGFGNFELKHNWADTIVFGNSQVYVAGKLKCAGLSSEGSNRFLKENNIKPYSGLIIPPEYSGRWVYKDNKIIKVGYTIGEVNIL